MIITEEEKKQILSKYHENTSNELLNYLKRHFPVSEIKFEWKTEPTKQMFVDDKLYTIKNNKKYLVGKIFNYLEDDWQHLEKEILRRTIKKYIDGYLF
jgi:septum formation topological specificity factor MinE